MPKVEVNRGMTGSGVNRVLPYSARYAVLVRDVTWTV